MKHIIIEGPNNIGKDTLIKNIIINYNKKIDNVIIRHFVKPPLSDNPELYQKTLFNEALYFKNLLKEKYNYFTLIWNRSHLGEWVYGYIWRKYEASWIWSYEKYLNDADTYLILLTGDYEFIHNVNKNSKIKFQDFELREFIRRFDDAFEKSRLKKIKIRVNKDENTFISSDIIFNQVKEFVNL